jgi:type I restriction enzyme M protein
MKSKNERITENIVREYLYDLGYKDDENIIVEEQKSENPTIQKCLQNASKSGKGVGKPEFMIRSTNHPDFIIVVECKADVSKHQSPNHDQYKDFAIDGVLNYASYLCKQYNVIAVAVSGQTEKEVLIDTFLWVKNDLTFTHLTDNALNPIKKFLLFDRYVQFALYNHKIEQARFADLISFSKDVHNYIRDYAKLSETEKPLLVSGILLALQNNAFALSYKHLDQKSELATEMTKAIDREIEKADIPKAKKKNMVQPYSFISVHPELIKINPTIGETPLFRLISDIDQHVKPFINTYQTFDVIGQFYGEFLRYTGGDGKGLGIVLTPKHITELFAKLANLTPKSIVLDTCAGTSGFLISAMYEMIRKANGDEDLINNVKKNGLIGVEQQPNMYALAASNMILRGDGKANLYQGSCFDDAITKEISGKADVGFINPPYSQKGEGLHELDFVNHLLNCLKPNGLAIAIVPMSCAIAPHLMRDKILENHRLDAVVSMPDDLFYPIGVNACIMIFSAHIPHEQNEYHQTWFGYWKNDGFIKTKHKGRIDNGNWVEIRENWLSMYFSKSQIKGASVLQKVNASDEWCAEAYMETDYSVLTEKDYMKFVKNYVLFKISNEQ